MAQSTKPLTISKTHARRFLLRHQELLPPRKLKGKAGILAFIQKVGCIQFDPINVVGRNPDLVLQSRISHYRDKWLEELLYQKRVLWDGWDKMRAIYQTTDWPNFSRYRASVQERYADPTNPVTGAMPDVLKTLREEGPMSSIDFKDTERVDWWWGTQASLAKSALDILYASGEIGVHHKVGTRRVFDLIERLLPAQVFSALDPHKNDEAYENWHVLRRVGGLGLVHAGPSEFWGGILGVKNTSQRSKVLENLVKQGMLVPVFIKELGGRTFFIRESELEILNRAKRKSRARPRAAIVTALDNLLWDRKLISWIFDFDYVWEVYKPVEKREYGYYVLPILFGDRFIGRFDPTFDRESGELVIKGWWWEDGVDVTDAMVVALRECFSGFLSFVGAKEIRLGDGIKGSKRLDWVSDVSVEHTHG